MNRAPQRRPSQCAEEICEIDNSVPAAESGFSVDRSRVVCDAKLAAVSRERDSAVDSRGLGIALTGIGTRLRVGSEQSTSMPIASMRTQARLAPTNPPSTEGSGATEGSRAVEGSCRFRWKGKGVRAWEYFGSSLRTESFMASRVARMSDTLRHRQSFDGFEAAHALPADKFVTKSGQCTNAVYGLCSSNSAETPVTPSHIGVAFDVSLEVLPHEGVSSSKGARDATPEGFRVELISQVLD